MNLATLAVLRRRGPLARLSVSCFMTPSFTGSGFDDGIGGGRGAPPNPGMGMPPPNLARRARMPPVVFGDASGFSSAFCDDICMRASRSCMDPPGGVFGVVGSDDGLRGMGGGGPPLPVLL